VRGSTLRAAWTRVTRLTAAYQVDRQPETIFIRWAHPYDRCPACGYDLDAHSRAAAVAEAQAADGAGAPPRRVIFYGVDDLESCPTCGVIMPNGDECAGTGARA
jgi:hypothetical protein